MHRAHEAGLAGASVFRGIEGFGASYRIHTSRLLSLSEDLPVVIVIVDTEERVRAFLPQLDELVTEGLVILDDCEVIRYAGTLTTAPRPPKGRSRCELAAGDRRGRRSARPCAISPTARCRPGTTRSSPGAPSP